MRKKSLIGCVAAILLLAFDTCPSGAAPHFLLAQSDTTSPGTAPKAPATPAEPGKAGLESATLAPAGNQNESGRAESDTSAVPAKANRPIKLYGRIEELCATPGAKFPIKLQALTPKMDARRPLSAGIQTQTLPLRASAAYPVDWAGAWSGTVKIWAAQFDPSRWRFDAAEASQEQDLMRPGKEGQVTFNFSQDSTRHIQLEPTQVVFTAPMDQSRYQQSMQQAQQQIQQMMGGMQGMPGMQEMFGSGPSGQMMSEMIKSVPYMYALHLGNLVQGTGVTGNLLESRVEKNDVKLLAANTLEQQIVTYNEDQSRATGKKHFSFSETVLRFTRLNRDQLYVQAASVDYDRYGKFEGKVVLYGTINRGQAASPILPNMFNGGGLQNIFPFGQ